MSEASYTIERESTLTFSFVSEGKKGRIEKLIKFEPLQNGLFNLAFGDRVGTSLKIDTHVVTDNGDIVRVIASVISALITFLEEHPQAHVIFKGSDQRRTNFYCRVVKNHRKMLGEKYLIFGRIGDKLELFVPDKTYEYLLIFQK